MSADPNKKTGRTFQCRDVLWETFEQMARELECSVDYLVNEAMKQYARQRNYGSVRTPNAGIPGFRPTAGCFSCRRSVERRAAVSADACAPWRQCPAAASGVGASSSPARRWWRSAGFPRLRRGAPPHCRRRLPSQALAGFARRTRPCAPAMPGLAALGPSARAVSRAAHDAPPWPASARGDACPGWAAPNGFPVPVAQTATLSLIYQGERQSVTKDRFVIGRGKQSE